MRRLVLLLGLAALPAIAQEPVQQAAVTPPPAPASSPIGMLMRQGQRWLEQGRPELAAASVQRALSAEPNNAELLSLAVRIEATRNNREAAMGYIARLRAAGASPAQLDAAETEIRAASIDRNAIEEARRLSRENRPDEALAAYRNAFGNREPPSAFAREYYQALAATSAGREAGRRGLWQLAEQPGADERTLLANAEQLTYAPQTRAEGLRRFAELAARPAIAADTQRLWKQALGFYGTDPAAKPFYEEYLRRFPADAEIKARLQAAQAAPAAAPAGPGDQLRRSGFAELESGSLRSSARSFEQAVALDPKDADALGGLGVVRLRENRPAEARDLLERAIAADPARAGQWRRALDGANYTLALAQARTLLRRGDTSGAEEVLRRAIRRDVDDATDAESMLGETAQRRGDAKEAEQHFRAALARRPGFAPAVTGLAQALRSQGRVAEANALRPPAPPRGPENEAPSANAEVARLRTEAARAADPATQASILNGAMAITPNDPWLRLDLARALRRMGREPEGRALVEELAQRGAADASYAAALYAEETGNPADADAYLSRIPPQRRTPDMARLQVRVRSRAEVARAAALLPASPTEGRQLLLRLAARPDPTGTTAAEVIRAFGAAGDGPGAVEAARVAEATNYAAAARIAIAGALLGAGQDTAAAALAARLESGTLTGPQRRDLVALRTGTAIRAADRLNEQGDQAAAYERLRPALTATPDDPGVELALARLYQGARRPAEAQRIAESILARNPRDWDARRAAVEAAIDQGDRRRAEALANEGRRLDPNESRAILLQARVARANGDGRRARALLGEAAAQRGQELGRDQNPFQSATPAPALGANPFAASGAVPAGSAPRDQVSRDIAQELALVQQDLAPRISGSAVVRTRSGTSGLDALTEIAVPIEARGPLGHIPGQFSARIMPVYLDSGQLTSSNAALRFGTNALAGTSRASTSSTATGVGFRIGYQHGSVFAVDVGSSPVGFRMTNIVGGFEVAPRLADNIRLRLIGERRSVLDSVLSYAGERDPVSGQTWGGVTQTGGRVQLEGKVGAGSAYVLGGYAGLDGTRVAPNTRREAGAGFSYPIMREADSELTSGLDLVYFSYDNNQRGFTLGQGGYFSPQSFVAVNLPLQYSARLGNLRYKLGGTVGYASFREDASPLFPGNPFLQAQVEAANRANPTIPARNQGQTKNGLTGGVRIDLEYPLTDSLSLAGTARYDKAADFEEARVSVRLESRF